MGFIREAKKNSVTSDAQQAIDEGRHVLAVELAMPTAKTGMSGEIRDWSEMIESIESVGWRLEQWSVNGAPAVQHAYVLFRR